MKIMKLIVVLVVYSFTAMSETNNDSASVIKSFQHGVDKTVFDSYAERKFVFKNAVNDIILVVLNEGEKNSEGKCRVTPLYSYKYKSLTAKLFDVSHQVIVSVPEVVSLSKIDELTFAYSFNRKESLIAEVKHKDLAPFPVAVSTSGKEVIPLSRSKDLAMLPHTASFSKLCAGKVSVYKLPLLKIAKKIKYIDIYIAKDAYDLKKILELDHRLGNNYFDKL